MSTKYIKIIFLFLAFIFNLQTFAQDSVYETRIIEKLYKELVGTYPYFNIENCEDNPDFYDCDDYTEDNDCEEWCDISLTIYENHNYEIKSKLTGDILEFGEIDIKKNRL